MIIKAGTKIRCSQGHDCGEVTRDIDTDQNVVVPHPARGRRSQCTSRIPLPRLTVRPGPARPVVRLLLASTTAQRGNSTRSTAGLADPRAVTREGANR